MKSDPITCTEGARLLLEYRGDKSRYLEICSADVIRQLLETMRSFPCTRDFSMVDLHKELDPRPLPHLEIHFILKCIVLWFCEMAEEGTIIIDELVMKDDVLMVKLQLHTSSLVPGLEEKHLYMTLARHILDGFGGDCWMKTEPERLEAGFQMKINAP